MTSSHERVNQVCRLAATLTLALAVSNAPASEPSTDAPALERARVAAEEGRFQDAEALLRPDLGDPDVPVTGASAIALENMRRIRHDFALTPEAMLEKLRNHIADVTAEDVERWRDQGMLQHRVIDGQIRFFRREPSNLFRFCEEARKRRLRDDRPTPAGNGFSLPEHLARLIEAAEESDDPEVYPVKHYVRYRLTVPAGHPRVRAGAKVRCWLPFPQEHRQQGAVRLTGHQPCAPVIAPNGNPHRTLYYEQVIEDASKDLEFVAEYEFVTAALCPKLDPDKAKPWDMESAVYRAHTGERPPHIVFTPEVRSIAQSVAGDEKNPLLKARKLYQWVCENIRYCAEMEYSTIPNLSAKAIDTRRGDCGVQAMAFITLCRAAGIPARWQSGWQTLPDDWNMHDWAEFYVEPWGWLPADPSYRMQDHSDIRVREFYFGHIDPYRMIVNLDYAGQLHPPKTSYRSEPNDFQRGEIEIDGHNLYFDEWDWTFEVRNIPLVGTMAGLEEAMAAAVPDLLRDGGIPGAVVAVGRRSPDGFETWKHAYGYARIEPEAAPMREDAVFDLASLTKPMAAATSMMILVDEGRLGIEDPVAKYLAEFGADKKDVTIRHLMSHTSGTRAYLSPDERAALVAEHGFPCTSAIREMIRTLEPPRKPEERFEYSCLNAILCGEIIETVSGQPLDRFARERIYEPLGMSDAGYLPSKPLVERAVPTTKADASRGIEGFIQGQVHDPLAAMQGGVSGNAGLFGTADDLARYARMILNKGEFGGRRILTPESVRLMTTDQTRGVPGKDGKPHPYGLFWAVYPGTANGTKAARVSEGSSGPDGAHETRAASFGHTGYTGTAMRISPDLDMYVITLTNRVHPDDKGKVEEFRRVVWETAVEALTARKASDGRM